MGDRRSTWLGILGVAASVVAGAVILFAHTVQQVAIPRPMTWPGRVGVCAVGVQPEALDRAVGWWAELGHPVSVGAPCDVSISVDRAIEDHGITACTGDTATWKLVECSIRVRHQADALTLAHELGHGLGYAPEHVGKDPPTGHMMHPRHPGWNDSRGLAP